MHGFLKTGFADRWLWLCPVPSLVLAAAVLMLFGFRFWGSPPCVRTPMRAHGT